MNSVTVFTIQKIHILNRLAEDGVFRAEWSCLTLGQNELIAYREAAAVMLRQGSPLGTSAPIWGWQTEKVRLTELARELLSDNELGTHDYGIIELDVPDELVLRTSYHEWCNAFFETIETGVFPSGDNWLNHHDVVEDEDDVVQVLLPYILHSWLVGLPKQI